MANEWKITENSKHINTRYHFLRSHTIRGTIAIYYVNTKDNIADLGTKPLDYAAHYNLVSKFMEGEAKHDSLYQVKLSEQRASKRKHHDGV
jgi:hypothetical protein